MPYIRHAMRGPRKALVLMQPERRPQRSLDVNALLPAGAGLLGDADAQDAAWLQLGLGACFCSASCCMRVLIQTCTQSA